MNAQFEHVLHSFPDLGWNFGIMIIPSSCVISSDCWEILRDHAVDALLDRTEVGRLARVNGQGPKGVTNTKVNSTVVIKVHWVPIVPPSS